MHENAGVRADRSTGRNLQRAPHAPLDGATLGPVSTLAERMSAALKASGLKKRDVDERVAAELGRSARGMNGLASDVASGTREPTASVLAALARVLGVSGGWLLSGDGSMRVAEGALPPAGTYAQLPGWAEAAALEERRERLPVWAVRAAGRSPVLVKPVSVTAEVVYAVASCWLATASEEAREAARLA